MQAIRFISNARRLMVNVALVAVLLALGTMASVPHAQAAQTLPVEALLNSDGTLNTSTGASGAVDLRGWNVTLDSVRGPVLTPQASAPANASASGWSPLANNGLLNSVYALAVIGTDLYVGGAFTETADRSVTNLHHIAKYSGGAWYPLANNGLDQTVQAIAVSGTNLYVGGWFTQSWDGLATNLNYIAKYNTSTNTWSALANNGLDDWVAALAVSGTDLYVGGFFDTTKDGVVQNLHGIAKYNTSTNTWWALANYGVGGLVRALAVSGPDLYIGGQFGGSIVKYNSNTNTLSALAHNGLNNNVNALAVIGTDLYVGGNFTQSADGAVTNLNHIAKYSGGAWSALANNGLGPNVFALAVIGTDLYVGGNFTKSADGLVTNLNSITKYNISTNTWSALANNGLNDRVWAIAMNGTDLYVSGDFSASGDWSVSNLYGIARYGASAAPGYRDYLPLVIK